jgi:hypothetical protein
MPTSSSMRSSLARPLDRQENVGQEYATRCWLSFDASVCLEWIFLSFIFLSFSSLNPIDRHVARIFLALAVIATLLLAANFVVGLAGGDFNAAAQRKREAQVRVRELERQGRGQRARSSSELDQAIAELKAADAEFHTPRRLATLHMLLGSAAAMMTVLVSSISVTYFIGTSRWCKEVCETYGISGDLAERSARLKRNTFPWSLAGILAIIAVVALGAAADPSGANWGRAGGVVVPHYLGAMIGLVIVMASFWMQLSRIAENHAVIEEILAEVARIRAERELPIEKAVTP